MVGRDAPEVIVVGIRSHPFEERADLPFPALEVGTQDRGLVIVGELARGEVLCAAAEEQAALALGAEVADPLRVPARRDEVSRAFEGQQVDRVTSWLTGLSAADLEHPRPGDAHPEAGEAGHGAGGDVWGEPAGTLVALGATAILTSLRATAKHTRVIAALLLFASEAILRATPGMKLRRVPPPRVRRAGLPRGAPDTRGSGETRTGGPA